MSVIDWCRRHNFRLKGLVIGLGVLAVLIRFVQLAAKPKGDFLYHYEFGRRLRVGEFIYTGNFELPYMPFWALVHVPSSQLSVRAAILLCYPLFLVSFLALLWTLRRLTAKHFPSSHDGIFWGTVGAVALTSRFLLRDMIECGVNLALVALSWLAIFAWTKRREWLGGLSLGLAIALKCTPVAFLAYFLWKRQWKMATLTSVFAIGFALSPALWMGTRPYSQALEHWYGRATLGFVESDPSRGVLGDELLYNISLRPALAAILMRLPTEHASYYDHPFYSPILDLSPTMAGRLIKIGMLTLAAAVAWSFRGAIRDRASEAVLWQCAAISVAILLYSPITWAQHCVGVLPAMYLIVQTALRERRLPRGVAWAGILYVICILILNRAFVGGTLTTLFDAYRLNTWLILALFAVTLWYCRRVGLQVVNAQAANAALLARAA